MPSPTVDIPHHGSEGATEELMRRLARLIELLAKSPDDVWREEVIQAQVELEEATRVVNAYQAARRRSNDKL